MILYPIFAKISISYPYLSWSFMCSSINQSQRGFWWFFFAILLVNYTVFHIPWYMDQSFHQFLGKYYNVSCSKIPELLGHTFPTSHRINWQGTCYSKYSICKIFWRYTNSKKDMDIDMIWYNILMVFGIGDMILYPSYWQDMRYDIIS